MGAPRRLQIEKWLSQIAPIAAEDFFKGLPLGGETSIKQISFFTPESTASAAGSA